MNVVQESQEPAPNVQTSPRSRSWTNDDIPFDILAMIFLQSLPEVQDERDLTTPSTRQSPLNVSHVCRSWRQSALLIPQLWARIYFDLSECRELRILVSRAQSVQEFVKRSADADLWINVTCNGNPLFNAQESWDVLGDFIVGPIAAKYTRWRMARIVYPSQMWQRALEKEPRLVLGGLAALERFRFFPAVWPNNASQPGSLEFDISPSQRLREVRLSDTANILFARPAPTFINLTNLEFTNCMLSSSTTLALLTNSPNLEHLRLRRIVGVLEGNNLIVLGNLRKLQLGEHVRLFGITNVRYTNDRSFRSLLERIVVPRLQEMILLVTGRGINVSSVLQHTSRVLRGCSPHLTKFALECNEADDASLLSCLVAMPLVEELDIMLWNQDLSPLLGQLTISPGEIDQLCSRLTTLTIRHSSPVQYTEAISRMLLSRSPAEDGQYAVDDRTARFGTAVLRRLKIVYSWITARDDNSNFTADSTIACMIKRGLEFEAGLRSTKFESHGEE